MFDKVERYRIRKRVSMKHFAIDLVITLFLGACALHNTANNAGHAGMNQGTANTQGNHQAMNHGNMDHSSMQSSPNASGAPYDLQFIDTMVMHHQGAVDMAEIVRAKGEHTELKDLAKSIIADQQREIAEMRKWREAWFAGQAPAVNMEMKGMSDSMHDMDMHKLDSLSGNECDLEFINQMIPHHDGAVAMAKEALEKSERPEIKTLANNVIKLQAAEIEKMQDWQNAWQQ
jgi:uncharacterized protein (DUF305 family)